MRVIHLSLILLLSIFFTGCNNDPIEERASVEKIEAQLAKLASVELTAEMDKLSDGDRKAVETLVRGARIIDAIFLEQVYSGNPDILKRLERSSRPEDRTLLTYFSIMFGPWDRLDENRPFLNNLEKLPGANFYPTDMTKEEFTDWIESHPEDKEAFESEYTLIRRNNNKLIAVPYPEAYGKKLKPLSRFLRKASEETTDPTLRTFLQSRAEALLSNDYFQSDMDWMDIEGPVEIVIGPYEVYEDHLFGYKAAYESFICIADLEESQTLAKIAAKREAMESNLPIPEKYKNYNRGASSPIKVVDVLYTAGDAKSGIQTIAFNLPNDERVREAKGSKNVMMKNVQQAKYDKVFLPIANRMVSKKDIWQVSFDAFFRHTILHEISHGLGPGRIELNGRTTTVRAELKECYSTIEECKADVLGIYNAQFLIDEGVLPAELKTFLYSTYLAGMFRSIRFGIDEAHGGGVALQLNYLLDKDCFRIDRNGYFTVVEGKIREGIESLAREILMIQARGDYEGARRFLQTYRNIHPEVALALEKIRSVPVDIRPQYPIAEALR